MEKETILGEKPKGLYVPAVAFWGGIALLIMLACVAAFSIGTALGRDKNPTVTPTPSTITPTPTRVPVSPTPSQITPTVTVTVTPSVSVKVTASPSPSPSPSVLAHKYNFDTEAVPYEPDTSHYGGYRICDTQNSVCTVYGIKYDYIAKGIMGGRYRISFDEIGRCGAAAGTSYCDVVGPAVIVPLQ